MNAVHLITGATGFVGTALALELLSQTSVRIACLTRVENDDAAAAQSRLERVLSEAAIAYGKPDIIGEIRKRCIAVPGDIVRPCCGEAAIGLKSVAQVWHCAASLKYKQEHQFEIFLQNVKGTRNVLDLARFLHCAVFNHMSTAYVAGRRPGRISEDLPAADAQTNNCYEESKIHAELLVCASGIPARILRPSIVIGHSHTFAATSTAGLYGCIAELLKTRQRASRSKASFAIADYRLRMLANPEATLNLIPVDVLARNAVRLSLANAPARVYHLANACPPTIDVVTRVVFSSLGMPQPLFVDSEEHFTPLDAALHRATRFYGSYLQQKKTFALDATNALLGLKASRCLLGEAQLRPYVDWYLAASSRRQPTAVSRRQDIVQYEGQEGFTSWPHPNSSQSLIQKPI